MKRRTGLKNGTKIGVKKGGGGGGGGNNNNNTNTNTNKQKNGKKKGGKSKANKSKDAAKTPQDLDMQMDSCIYIYEDIKYFFIILIFFLII